MTESETKATRFCARAIGPFLVIAALMVLTRYDTLPMLLPSLLRDAPLVFVTGTWTTILGLTILAGHHHFGSPAAMAITTIAVIIILRGALLLVMPETLIAIAGAFVRTAPVMYVVVALTFVLGGWLSYVGWVAKRV